MTTLSDLERRLEPRIAVLEQQGEVQRAAIEQNHLNTLDDGAWSDARAYWHHGYMMACKDILALIRALKEKDHEEGE